MTDKQQRSWIKDFTFELKKRRLSDQIIWRVSCRVDEVDGDIISLLQEVGLSFLYLGIESGSPDGLRTFNKHYDVDQIYTTLNLLEKTGMSYDYGFMLLEPYATFKTIKEDLIFLDNLCKNGRTVLHFTKLLPYAGTPIADRLRTEKRLKGDIATPDYDYLDSRINLFEYFLTKGFFDMFFSTSGLTNRLQLAKFDAIVIKKFLSDNYDVRKYICDIDNLTNICNRSALDTMNLVADFMNESSYDDIRRHRNTLDMQALQQANLQKDILRELDRLKPISLC
jgi:anaerobic magnesium-protoporphyrin IX monomethyl ester cyclase